jgi:L,D-peptidoglycan transpeptidase YkuD (ErfK/YbiS/YcfS/YnhG family)
MWRGDNLYDLVVVLSHNRVPRQQGLGSAVFMHVARPGFSPTAGCVALSARDLALVLGRVGSGATIAIGPARNRTAKRPRPHGRGRILKG